MKTMLHYVSIPLLFVFIATAGERKASAQSTAFNYQGRLAAAGIAASGTYDFTFALFATNSGGSPVGAAFAANAVQVSNGLFTATMDFGNVFNGTTYWLEIALRPSGSAGGFTTLSPRQLLTPTPYALQARTAAATTGAIADNQLSGNVALLNGNANFTGMVTAGQFRGNGAGLTNVNATSTNVVVVTNDSGTAVLRGNNGGDFASLTTTRSNLGGIKYLYGGNYLNSYQLLSNNPPDFYGQLALAQNGASWPYLAHSLTSPDHMNPFLGSNWCGSFRFTDICQFGSPAEMATNAIGNSYVMLLNGYPGQEAASAAKWVLKIENEHTNCESGIAFTFAVSNNFLPAQVGMEIGAGNGGSGPWEVPALSNAAFILTGSDVPLNFCMQQRGASGPYPPWLTAFFDGLTTDFHYLANNGSNVLWLRASDGSAQMDGSLGVRGSVTIGTPPVAPQPSAVVDVESSTAGFLPPRMTKAQRNAISSPAAGLIIYQTDAGNNGLRYYDGTNWNKLASTTD